MIVRMSVIFVLFVSSQSPAEEKYRLEVIAHRPDLDSPVAVSPNGRLLARAIGKGSVIVRDLHSGAERRIAASKDRIASLAISHDSRHLVAIDRKTRLSLWNIAGKQVQKEAERAGYYLGTSAPGFVVFSRDRPVVLFSTGSRAATWNWKTGRVSRVLEIVEKLKESIVGISSDAVLAATVGNEGFNEAQVTIWSVFDEERLTTLRDVVEADDLTHFLNSGYPSLKVELSTERRLAATFATAVRGFETVRLWNFGELPKSGQRVCKLGAVVDHHAQLAREIEDIGFSGDARSLFVVRSTSVLVHKQGAPAKVIPLKGFLSHRVVTGENTAAIVGKASNDSTPQILVLSR